MARICVITAGHLSTCPRMLKAADALQRAGYFVRVVSAGYVPWAATADAALRRRHSWAWRTIDFDRKRAPFLAYGSGLRQRLARGWARLIGTQACGLAIAGRAYLRVYPELLAAALADPADLYYAGGGALLVAAEAARRTGGAFGLDLEDFHSGEQEGELAWLGNGLARRIEREILPRAHFLTAASGAISEAYQEAYGVRPLTINNTFPLPADPPPLAPPTGPLKLYWFSQTVGPQRGLEEVVQAVAASEISAELHLRGRAIPGYREALGGLAAECGTRLKIFEHLPASPDRMVELCGGYDIGLAVEQPHTISRSVCLTNKAFTYILAGLAVIFTDTPGQRGLATDLGEAAAMYPPGDVAALAKALRRWDEDRTLLARAQQAAWEAARRRWHWEHDLERGALLRAVAAAVGK
jgi:glycosyltransferase involved in cell wall biosynthesis